MPWKPQKGERFPSLGWLVLDWMSENLATSDDPHGSPFEPTPEQARFIVNLFRVDEQTGRELKYRRAVLSRPRGWGKSPLMAALCAAFGLCEHVVPDGFDSHGQPQGRPLRDVRTPWIQVAGVTDDSTKNTWKPLLQMLRNGAAVENYPGLEVLDTMVILPGDGLIETITSSAGSVKGARCVMGILDQSELWTKTNGGHDLADVMRDNSAKVDGLTIESPNAFTPGLDSIAERSALANRAIKERAELVDDGVLYDHREAPPDTDLWDDESILTGLAIAYGDSADVNGGWVNIRRLMREGRDLSKDPQSFRANFLNQITHAADAWLSQPEWAACCDATKVVADKDVITLGFDGSRGRTTPGKIADSTVLMGCRVSDGHLFPIGIWEQPTGSTGEGWQPPVVEIEAAVRETFARYTVVGFFADPAKWEGHVTEWEGKYNHLLKVKSSLRNPIAWPMNRSTLVARETERLHNAIIARELTHDGSSAITRHFLNARRRAGRGGIHIAKDHPDSARKIDGAVSSILAYAARAQAVAAGLTQPVKRRYAPKQLW